MRNLNVRDGFFDFDLRDEISAIFVKIRQNLNFAPKYRNPILNLEIASNGRDVHSTPRTHDRRSVSAIDPRIPKIRH